MTKTTTTRIIFSLLFVCAIATVVKFFFFKTADAQIAQPAKPAAAPVITYPTPEDETYPYTSLRFAIFVDESRTTCLAGKELNFFSWMDTAYNSCNAKSPGRETLPLKDLIKAKREELAAISNPADKTKAVITLASWIHKMIKTTIPKFSLDRGFEFFNTVRFGERQCFLQSILIASILQEMGVYAGVVMVFKNIEGAPSNNGHAVVLIKLPDGKDILDDASDPEPFATQQGLLVRASDYTYVTPSYEPETHKIRSYTTVAGGRKLLPSQVRTLDYPFLRSQFWYYRGERVQGGLVLTPKTTSGLKTARNYLHLSIEVCPQNPLSIYMLGRVYLALGRKTLARRYLQMSHKLYSKYGWIPDGPKEYVKRVR